MCHSDPLVLKLRGPCAGVPCRSEDHRYLFIHDDLHDFINLWVHQRNVDPERLIGGLSASVDMLTQGVGVHGASTDQSQSTAIADRCGEPPAAAPYHASLDHRVADAEKATYAVLNHPVDFLNCKDNGFKLKGASFSLFFLALSIFWRCDMHFYFFLVALCVVARIQLPGQRDFL